MAKNLHRSPLAVWLVGFLSRLIGFELVADSYGANTGRYKVSENDEVCVKFDGICVNNDSICDKF